MDNYSVKRSIDGAVVPRRSSGIVLREPAEDREQFCNRLGCKGRLNHTKVTQNGCSGKYKSSRSLPVNRSDGMEVIGTSSSTRSVVGSNTRKAVGRSQRSPGFSKSETVSTETTSGITQEDERHDSETGKVSVVESGNSSLSLPKSSSNKKKVFGKKLAVGTQSPLYGSSDVTASKSKITIQSTRSSAASTSRYGLRNLKCNSISDVLLSGSSSSDSKLSKRKDFVKKRNSEVESSSSNLGRKMSGTFPEDTGYSTSNHGVYISESRRGGSSQSQRSVSGNNTRTSRFPNNGSRMEFPAVTPRSEASNAMGVSFTSNRFPAEASSSSRSTPFASPVSGSSYSLADMLPMDPRELGIPMHLEGLRRHNVDGIAEALLALQRIEQDEELTYEQLMALDANLFLGGLGFYDQHREMRLDIDNMSYEELLVLEEKMGSVSTALSEEAISKSLRCSIFLLKAFEGNKKRSEGDENDIKCSVCQEEYQVGDEVGKLKCEHGYHKTCIRQWLRLKNWCPICKAPAAVPSPST